MGLCWSDSSAADDNGGDGCNNAYSIVGDEDLISKAAARAVDPEAFRYTVFFVPRKAPMAEGAMDIVIQDMGQNGSSNRKFYAVPRGSHRMVFTDKSLVGTSTTRFVTLRIDKHFPGGLPKKPDGRVLTEAYISLDDLKTLDECAPPFHEYDSKRD
ncbi:MAG: hypothetical protein AB7P49_02065 [Bdellovibrionales bacterium]